MKDVTLGKMVNLEQTTSLYIPIEWLHSFNDEKSDYAIFLKNNPTMFRFIPVKSKQILQFHMKLTVLEENFLQQLFEVFENINHDYKIKPIYSSGVCFVEEECYYFFLIEIVKDDVEQKLKESLQKLQAVEEIIVKKYTID